MHAEGEMEAAQVNSNVVKICMHLLVYLELKLQFKGLCCGSFLPVP